MKNTATFRAYLAVFFIWTANLLSGQADEALLKELAEANQQTIEALVLYPADTRSAILEATKYPSLLIQLQEMKERTSLAFQILIEDFPKEEQSIFYELNRYPELIDQVVGLKENAPEQKKMLQVLPSENQKQAVELVRAHPITLQKVQQLTQTAQIAYSKLILEYPIEAQAAFNQLLQHPEVLELLNQDLRFTILVGETFKNNPIKVRLAIDSLNGVVAKAQAEELIDWQQNLKDNPEAQEDLKAATEAYTSSFYPSQAYPSSDDLYTSYAWGGGTTFMAPYFYWFGPPWWEPYPRWYPYPWWWNWGGYYYGSQWVIIYLPSYHFMHWYFQHPHHHHSYNHLSEQFVRHYNKYRRSGTTISMEVKDWHNENRSVISETFLSTDSGLANRLKKYGAFENQRDAFNQKNPNQTMDAASFLDRSQKKFPELKQSKVEAQRELETIKSVETQKRTEWAPRKEKITPVIVPEKREQPARKSTQPTRQPQQPLKVTPVKPNDARDYHFQKWEERKTPIPDTKRIVPTNPTVPKKRGG